IDSVEHRERLGKVLPGFRCPSQQPKVFGEQGVNEGNILDFAARGRQRDGLLELIGRGSQIRLNFENQAEPVAGPSRYVRVLATFRKRREFLEHRFRSAVRAAATPRGPDREPRFRPEWTVELLQSGAD